MRTGKLHQTTTGEFRDGYDNFHKFDEWRICLNSGWIRVTFRKKNGRHTKWTSPFDVFLKREIKFTPEEWKQFDEEFKVLLERQKEKYPTAHKEQKSSTIKEINYRKKNWPKIMAEPEVAEWINYILPICRKRT
jgi:hypothetical protein